MDDETDLVRCGLWRGAPLVLASKSRGRARILRQAGVPFVAADSGLDEREVERAARVGPAILSERLALEKALRASASHPDRLVIGADQVLAFDGGALHKAASPGEAVAQLKMLRGREHRLHSAVAGVMNGERLFSFFETATIRMRAFGDRTLQAYAAAMGARLLTTVGAYEIEGLGANLIESVDGDMFTVVGLPLFPLLAKLRDHGFINEESGAS